jgi:hypothetical protein
MRRGDYACGSRQVNGCRFVVADLGLSRLIAGIRIACLPPWARERGWLGSSWRWYLTSGPSSMRRGLVTLRALPDDPENACFHSRRRRIPGNLPRAGHAGPVKAWLARPLAEPGELQRRALSICSQLQITPFGIHLQWIPIKGLFTTERRECARSPSRPPLTQRELVLGQGRAERAGRGLLR